MPTDIKSLLAELNEKIPKDSIWDYCGGGSYQVISLELNATSYEETGVPGVIVRYKQLSEGSFPEGQIWVRSVEDFQGSIEKDGQIISKMMRR